MTRNIKLTFAGAARTVTGSRFLVEYRGSKVLVDCGLYQGLKELRLRNWEDPPFNPHELDAVVLTHAHIDHTGYLPRLGNLGFSGPVYCHKATRDLCQILLPDSGHLQEEQARFANKQGFSRHETALPLYTEKDARRVLKQIKGVHFGVPVKLTEGLTATWHSAGHILGAAVVEVASKKQKVLFSGDLGTPVDEILPSPSMPDPPDALVVESTYGDRVREGEDPAEDLAQAVKRSVDRGGVLLIPAFAVGRTQEILWTLRTLEQEQRIPELDVAVNSPMAVDATEIYRRHPECLNEKSREVLESGKSLFSTKKTRFCRSVQESKALNRWKGPGIIISASGMLTGGRILHHLMSFLPRERNTVLLVGYQAAGTRGRRLLEGETSLKIFGGYHEVRAQVEHLHSFSAHADRNGLLAWTERIPIKPDRTFVVHGEDHAAEALTEALRERGWTAEAPHYLDTAEIG